MKANKKLIIILLTAFLISFPLLSAAEIAEIKVNGLEKSSKEIVEKQLPFIEGDEYQAEKLILSR